MSIKGITVQTVLVAPAASIAKEFYLGLILDRAAKAITVIASAEGGVEIEETARTHPEAVLRLRLHPLIGLQEHNVRRVAFFRSEERRVGKERSCGWPRTEKNKNSGRLRVPALARARAGQVAG